MSEEWTDVARSASPDKTKGVAAALAHVVEAGDVIALDGGLGAGKTQFTQGLAAGLGIEGPVTSPTFNVMVAYEGRVPLYHFDLYRLENAEELDDVAFCEYAEGDGVACIEWASKFADELPDDRLAVRLTADLSEERLIEACAFGPRSAVLLDAWCAALR